MRAHAVLAALGICMTAGLAHAATVELTTSGVFTNPAPEQAVTTGVGTSTFTWGIAAPYSTVSSLSFTGGTFAADTETGDAFVFGQLDYTNGAILVGSEATSVDLDVTVSGGVDGSQDFDLGLINTLNVANPVASADYVIISANLGSAELTIDGEAYVLEFLGFGDIDPNGGFATTSSFHVYEGASASASLLGRLTDAASVPELSTQSSASALFLLLGAATVLASRRRREA